MAIPSTIKNHAHRGKISSMIAVVVAKINAPPIRQAMQKAKDRELPDSTVKFWTISALAPIFRGARVRVTGAFGLVSARLKILEKKVETPDISACSPIGNILRTEMGQRMGT